MNSSRLSPTSVLTNSTQPTKTPLQSSQDGAAVATVAETAVDLEGGDARRNRTSHTTAFTVHFDDSNKFTKRHVRNLSLPVTKVYDSKVNWDGASKLTTANGIDLKSLGSECTTSAGTGTLKSSRLPVVGKAAAGNHSEGYFSSDAEDDPMHPKLFVAKLHNSSRRVSKGNDVSVAKEVNSQHSKTVLLKSGKENVFERNCETKMKEEDVEGELSDAVSEVSEAGTYTIDKEKDKSNVEVITARLNIDNTFGVNQQMTVAAASDELNSYDSAHSSLSWVNDWASHVVEHNSLTGINTIDTESSQAGRVVSPQQKQTFVSPSLERRGTQGSKIPSPLSNVRAQFRLTSQSVQPVVTDGNSSSVPNKQSPRSRRSIVQDTATTNNNRQSHHDECSDSSLETESFLLATERVVTALQARVTHSVDSGGESDADTAHIRTTKIRSAGNSVSASGSAIVTPTTSSVVIQSDSSASESGGGGSCSLSGKTTTTAVVRSSVTTPTATTRYNRAFSLRRGRLDETNKKDNKPTVSAAATSIENKPKRNTDVAVKRPTDSMSPFTGRASKVTVSTQQSRANPSAGHQTSATPHRSQSFTRTDCGRFSMRNIKMSQPITPLSQNKGPAVKKKVSGGRSNSTLSSREVEFQNWKRRKSYDPMKAAAEGKKKEAAKKQQVGSATSSTSQSKSSGNPVLRSASFHGTRQLILPSSSEDDDDDNDEEEDEEEVEEEAAPSAEEYEEEGEEDWIMPAAPRTSLESTPRGSHVSLYSNASNSSMRSRPKLEGVDNLVISAISGLSSKVRMGSSSLLKKLRYLYDEDGPKAHRLAAEIEQLEISEPASPHHAAAANSNIGTRSPSRELSTALRNLKRIESVIKVLDNVLFDNEDFH